MASLSEEGRAARARMLAERDEKRQQRDAEREGQPVKNTDYKLPNPTDEQGNPQNNPPTTEASETEKAAREAALHDETATIVAGSDEDYAKTSVDVDTTQTTVAAVAGEGGAATSSSGAKVTDTAPSSSEIDRMTKADLGKLLNVNPDEHSANDLKAMAKKQIAGNN